MNDLDSDLSLTPEQEERVSKLTPLEIENIDSFLLSQCTNQWQKQAKLVGIAVRKLEFHGVPDTFFSQRVRSLVHSGKLASSGDLTRMRYSEIRLPKVQSDD